MASVRVGINGFGRIGRNLFRAAYEAGVAGALCDEATRERLRSIGDAFARDS